MAKKRVSMKGMGADAFFAPPAEEKEEPVTQDESMQASQQTSTPTSLETGIPSSQDDVIPAIWFVGTPEEQQSDLPAKQDASIPVSGPSSAQAEQFADMPVKQQASEKGSQHTSKTVRQDLMKATYYIYPDQDLKLERIRLARRVRGERVDKSELIREAIDKLME